MKLWRCLRSEPQSGEDGIGSGPFRFANDPVLYPGQALGRLMDIVAVNVGDGFEQLLDAVVAGVGQGGNRHMPAAPGHEGDATRFALLSHPAAFSQGISAAAAARNLTDPPYSTATG